MTNPLIVAELSANHRGQFEIAEKLIDACAKAGAGAIKLQTWTPGTMVLDKTLVVQSGPWAGRNMSELYEEAHTPWEWHVPLFNQAKQLGMIGFSSVFDLQALDFLESIGCPMYKISSFDLTDLPLIRAVAKTKKPMVISTGMGSWNEIKDAYANAKNNGCPDITMLKCTSSYPAPHKSLNIKSMLHLKQLGGRIGFSDHSIGPMAAVVATSLGADMIEKHVTLDRADGGLDAEFSATPDELAELVRQTSMAADCAGGPDYFYPNKAEADQAKMRKSVWVIKDMHKGQIFTPDCLTMARPNTGTGGDAYDKVIGRRVMRRISANTPMSWDMLMK
tara:strand:- start:28435 stop:29436 length:1002 start_codon:yes stop_codon:yes gene_type:complete